MSDLIGLGVLKIPQDPWGGEYRIEEEYYLTCRPPNGDPYQVSFCPKILYNITGSTWMLPVLYNRREVLEKAAWSSESLIEARVRIKLWPIEGSTVREYKLFGDSLSTVRHPAPSNMVYYGTIVDGLYDKTTGWIVDDDAMMEHIIRAGYKFNMCQSKIYYTYLYEFGKTDGDVDMDRKQEFRIAYEKNYDFNTDMHMITQEIRTAKEDVNMVIYDIDEDVDGIDEDYLDRLVEKGKKRKGISYNMYGMMMLWDPDYHCRWSVTN